MRHDKRFIHFFGHHDLHKVTILKGIHKKLVGSCIHSLHLFAMNICRVGRAETIRQSRFHQVPGNPFPARDNPVYDGGEFFGTIRLESALFDNMVGEGDHNGIPQMKASIIRSLLKKSRIISVAEPIFQSVLWPTRQSHGLPS